MPTKDLARFRTKATIAGGLIAFPAILFYAILFHTAIGLPFEDDYEALLRFLNHMQELSSFSAKASYFCAAQFNEYKLFFAQGVAYLQFALLGHVNIEILCALGNGFILVLAIVLWKMFLPNHENLVHRMAFFIPISWLLFQLQYAETLNWAMPSLVNLPVLVFSFCGIYLLVLGTRGAFWGAMVCLTMAIAASGNGLLMIPLGMLILVLKRHFAHVVSWLAVSAPSVAAYAYRYNAMASQTRLQHSVVSTVIRARPLYAIAFIGNAAALGNPINFRFGGTYHSLNVLLSLLLGVVLSVFFVVVVKRGYVRRNQSVSYCVLFLLLTAVGVAGIRSDFGLLQSLSSRYKVYSALLVILAWFIIVEEFLQHKRVALRHNRILLVGISCAFLFSVSMDMWGWVYLTTRRQRTISGMVAFEHPVPGATSIGPILPIEFHNARFEELARRAPEILKQSMKLGIYEPPVY